MSHAPRVSIVLPVRDAAATLADALHSLAAQSLADFECLVVDNGSQDASPAIAAAAAARDARFRLLRADGGLVQALNRGVTAARAGLIARMDADDLAHPRRLERQWQALQDDPGLSIASCLVECFPAAAVGAGMRRYQDWLNALRTPEAIRDALFVESPIAHPSAMLRRAALVDAGGYRAFDGPEDYDLWLRLLLRGHRAAKVPEVLLRWRDSPRRLSRVDPRCHRRRFFATKVEHFPAAVARGTPLQIWGAGPTGRRWAAALTALGYPIRRFVDVAPRRWGREIHRVRIDPPQLPRRDEGFVLSAAGAPGARAGIDAWLRRASLRPFDDYLAVA